MAHTLILSSSYSHFRYIPPSSHTNPKFNKSLCSANYPRIRVSAAMAAVQESVIPSVIIGAGRVGQALQNMGTGKDIIVRRGEKVPENFPGPIFVCTRNDDLDAVLEITPRPRWEDLVFFQNGMLEPWLQSKGLANASQVLAYFAVAKLGEAPTDGKTETNPEGLTACSGKWASAIAARLHLAGLSCKVLDKGNFEKSMLEKLIWISAFMLVGARHQGSTVGTVEKEYRNEVVSLIKELASAAAAEKNIAFDQGLEERLCAYSRTVAHFPTALKEFKWRNGWFYLLSQKATADGRPDPCPIHTSWLKELGAI